MQGTRGRHPHRDLSTWSRQLPSGIPPPTRPHTPPMSPPWALSKTSTGLGCLVQIAGHMAWGRPNPPHGRGVSKSVLTWAGSSRAGVFVQNLLDMDGESKSSSRAGRLAQILLDMDFLCRHPIETSPRAAASSPRALPHLPAHPLHHGLSRPLSKPCDTSSAKGMRGDIPWWRD